MNTYRIWGRGQPRVLSLSLSRVIHLLFSLANLGLKILKLRVTFQMKIEFWRKAEILRMRKVETHHLAPPAPLTSRRLMFVPSLVEVFPVVHVLTLLSSSSGSASSPLWVTF